MKEVAHILIREQQVVSTCAGGSWPGEPMNQGWWKPSLKEEGRGILVVGTQSCCTQGFGVLLRGCKDHQVDAALLFACVCPACRELGEECDDMNKINGDGCSLFCLQELSFNCIGKSSSETFHPRWATTPCREQGKNQQYFQHFQLKSCHGRGKKGGICRFERWTYLLSFWSFWWEIGSAGFETAQDLGLSQSLWDWAKAHWSQWVVFHWLQ